MIEVDTLAPDFTLRDETGTERTLSEFRGSYVLLYFYPKDNTPGCTQEACMIRDAYDEYATLGITVIGVSADSPESHARFKEQHGLPFVLLSDTEKKVIATYGAKGALFTRRISYLIDPTGKVVRSYVNVDPAKHAGEVLGDIKEIIQAS
jgi:thioredoxin-dependent peroxiredoxin